MKELMQHFAQFGPVRDANVKFNPQTGLSRGFGFVIMNNQKGFDDAVSTQGHMLEGNKLTVEPTPTNSNRATQSNVESEV